LQHFPAFFSLKDQPALIVGGGEIVGLAIDDEPAEATAVHDRPPPSLLNGP